MEKDTENMEELKAYLNREWRDIGDNFIDRLLAKIEYEKLLEKQSQNDN